MQRWKVDFINFLKQGRSIEQSARLAAGRTVDNVQEERELDREFDAAWCAVTGETSVSSHRQLSPSGLEALLWAQCSDEMCAAYFGMTHADMLARVKATPALQRVYNTARDGGRAALQKAQFDAAMDGDKTMLKWLGQQHLGQADSVDDRPKQGITVNFNISDPGESYRRMLAGGGVSLPVTTAIPSPTSPDILDAIVLTETPSRAIAHRTKVTTDD